MQEAIDLSNETAILLWQGTRDTKSALRDLSSTVMKQAGNARGARGIIRPQQDVEFEAARAVWRATMAPTLYEAEMALHSEVNRRLAMGEPLAPIEHQRVTHFDTMLKRHGVFEGPSLAFLRAMSVLSHAALCRTLVGPPKGNAWLTSLVSAFEDADLQIAPHFRRMGADFPEINPRVQRLKEFVVGANVTALSIIAPASRYASLWTPKAALPVGVAMLQHIDALSRPQYTTARLHERHLPSYNNRYQLPNLNPFSITAEQVAMSGIWQLPSFQKTRYKRWCPANIVYNGLTQTAATMRMSTAVKVADGILWEDSGLFGGTALDTELVM